MTRRTDLLHIDLTAAPRNRGYLLLAASLLLLVLFRAPVDEPPLQEQRFVAGLRSNGVAYHLTTLPDPALLEFRVYWTREVR